MFGLKVVANDLIGKRVGIIVDRGIYDNLVNLNRERKIEIPKQAMKPTTGNKKIILGTVQSVTQKKASSGKKAKQACYKLTFDNTLIVSMELDKGLVNILMKNYDSYCQHHDVANQNYCNNDDSFNTTSQEEVKDEEDKEEEDETNEEEEDGMNGIIVTKKKKKLCDQLQLVDEEPALCDESQSDEEIVSGEEAVSTQGLNWGFKQQLDPSNNLYNNGDTRFKPEYLNSDQFKLPVRCLLSFLPLKYWKQVTHETNVFARKLAKDNKGQISGRKWKGDFTLNEIMKFHGL